MYRRRVYAIVCMTLVAICVATAQQYPTVTPGEDIVAFAGASGSEEEFTAVLPLSDGTYLIGGRCEELSWLPGNVVPVELAADNINSASDGSIAFVMQVNADLSSVEAFVHLPASTAHDVFRIRATNVPGETTGDIYISGTRSGVSDADNDGDTYDNQGYYIARLDDNFVQDVPDAIMWIENVDCPPRGAGGHSGTSAYTLLQPWDVASDGGVYYGRGAEYDWGWAIIEKLDSNGDKTVVDNWRTHWTETSEIGGTADAYDGSEGPLTHSGIVLKAGRGSLRSWTADDHNLWQQDGNGGYKKGKWPMDYFFDGPKGSGDDGGYTGYHVSNKMTARLGGIVVDRRSDHMYFGISTQSKFYDPSLAGQYGSSWIPDFEPTVVAMDAQGGLKWWSRCYHEFIDENENQRYDDGEPALSPPDQYIDGLAVDYTAANGGALVVVARCHGNNVINLWNGNQIEYADNPGWSYQQRFTGTHGNAHYSWIGRFSLDEEQIRHSTYLGELGEGEDPGGSYDYALLEGWYNLNSGWPDMNTTRIEANKITVDVQGNVYIMAKGRRTMTTSNAYQQMPKPGEGHSTWNEFVRVYKRDLTLPRYCTMLTAPWDISTENRSEGTRLHAVCPTDNGMLVVGNADINIYGLSLPSHNVPSWCLETPNDQEQEDNDAYTHTWDGLLSELAFDQGQQVSSGPFRYDTHLSANLLQTRLIDQAIALRYTLSSAQTVRVAIYDARGRLVTGTDRLQSTAGVNELVLPSGVRSRGCYLVRVYTERGVMQKKLVHMH